ncbi:DEAD/DEAH box helicase [Ignavigranum ruoffiae]|uniref:DEAD/DEAH box helicase n=1 Tax=Ignavigranum ruoffiae TaxID=89093 RepID=UPI003AFFD621
MKFNELHLRKELIETIEEMGFEEPTPIQQEAIPIALQGQDLIGQAQTGTGKTAAFGLPMLNKLVDSLSSIQGLVVAPTRELAIQVQEEIFRLGKGQRARVYVVYGGSPIGKQIDRIQRLKPDIVVGTPGRILDLIRRKVLKLDQLQTLVLDEADEMLNMGFIDDIKAIIAETPTSRQTLLFSATMPPAIQALGSQFLIDAQIVKIKAAQMTADLIEQFFVKCRDDEKFDILTRFLEVQNPSQAIVFCRTKKRVDEVGRGLSLRGFNAELIHGDITQQKRTSVIHEFRKGSVELLVATDVAARGLDISGVTHVYNYDIPQDPESYVHRIGRTGRAGQDGMSITFVQNSEMAYLRTIEKLTRKDMKPLSPPTDKEALRGQVLQLIERMDDKIAHDNLDRYRNVAKQLLEHYVANDVIAALLSEIISSSTDIEVEISPQKPLPHSQHDKKSAKSRRSHRSRHKGDKAKHGDHHQERSSRQRDRKGHPRKKTKKKGQFKIRQHRD